MTNKVNVDGSTELVDFRTDEEITLAENKQKIFEAKEYLNDTDWVVIKLNEASLKEKDIDLLLEKYADILTERDVKRNLINSIESTL